MTRFVEVVLTQGFSKPLDYSLPDHLFNVFEGVKVAVPFRGKRALGYVVHCKEKSVHNAPLLVIEALDAGQSIPKELIQLAKWAASYYGVSLGKMLQTMIPQGVRREIHQKIPLSIRRKKSKEELLDAIGILRARAPQQAHFLEALLQVKGSLLLTEALEKTGVSRSVVDALVQKGWIELVQKLDDEAFLERVEFFKTLPKTLNEEQKRALDLIHQGLNTQTFTPVLLHGVTGSGKTEVYLQAIAQAESLGKGALILVPEIALTPQTTHRFKSRFNLPIAVFHHRLSDGERMEAWKKVQSGEVNIVIGARSSVFAPIKDLGLVIVDEEHEGTYKQSEQAPLYHARDLAVMRASLNQCPVILGSATPSLESYHNALLGKYHLSTLSSRASEASSLPKMQLVDMGKKKSGSPFSDELLNGIEKRIGTGEQVILFLNRRGYHSNAECQSCHEPVKCRHCAVTLTFHRGANTLSCHLCGFSHTPPPRQCPKCHSDQVMLFKGVGTELIERSLHAIFPSIRTLRIDADTTRHKGSVDTLLNAFSTGKADLLIGTQMIAKGHHFPEVTLVGVLHADMGLHVPDFRSGERSFQLLTQVAGRSGRGSLPGEVIVQTYLPDHPILQYALSGDWEAFSKMELEGRKILRYPPFEKLVKVGFSGPDEKIVTEYAHQVRQTVVQCLPRAYEVLPILPCGYAKIKDRFRYQFLVKGASPFPMQQAIGRAFLSHSLPKEVRQLMDVDPITTFF